MTRRSELDDFCADVFFFPIDFLRLVNGEKDPHTHKKNNIYIYNIYIYR